MVSLTWFLAYKIDFESMIFALFNKLVFTNYNDYLSICWFLAKNLSFKDPPSLKFHNRTDTKLKVWVSIEIFSAQKLLTMRFWLWGMERKRARIIGWSKIPGVPTGAMRGTLKWPEISIFVELLTNLWCLWCKDWFEMNVPL